MDILIRLRDFWISFISWLSPSIVSFIIRIGLTLLVTNFLLTLAWLRLYRSVFTQICVALIGVMIGLYIPTEAFRGASPGSLAFSVTLFFLCIIFLPNLLPSLLVPRYGDQLKLKRIIKRAIWILFILQIIFYKS